MDSEKKEVLCIEAQMQTKMIKNLMKWFRFLLGLSATGIVLMWWGIDNGRVHIIAEISGILFIIICLASACIIAKGVRNGRKNIAKILLAAESHK